MSRKENKDKRKCFRNCEKLYDDCMKGKEHDSVCQMNNNRCSCGCMVS